MNHADMKSKPLFGSDVINDLDTSFDQDEIKKLIPHREPFLLVDKVTLVNRPQRLIQAERRIDALDPVFSGHFPENPIYPGVLQQESMFQTALILMYFLVNDTATLPLHPQITNAVGTRVHDVFHLHAVRPGDTMTIRGCITDYDSLLATAVVQISVGNLIVAWGKGDYCVV
jgi:3-hydroxymyristoyl/3-hydroxydecanoyl-(acyl carrier protein) dehydratase